MTYAEVIKNNCEKYNPSWWCSHAYHYTDVTNAISILSSGKLYSRIKAEEFNVLKNENASHQVIDMTTSGAQSYVRFYFRPLTPTQYYNEGYKHVDLRHNNDSEANVPVPVFLVFNLEKLLSDPKTCFSELTQAGSGSQRFSGEQNFETLQFDKIYSNGAVDDETRKYRHAEILYPNEYNIDDAIELIVCRNDVEKNTLLNLLLRKDQKAFYKYKSRIKICRADMFENNGLFIDNVYFDDTNLSIKFHDSYSKQSYDNKMLARIFNPPQLKPLCMLIKLNWETSTNIIICTKDIETKIDYLSPKKITIKNLPTIQRAKKLCVTVYLDNKLTCYQKFDLQEINVF